MNDLNEYGLSCEAGGCSAKLAAQELDELLKDIPVLRPPELLIGLDTHDDAAVWKISDDVAIIQTTDFFPAICRDPYTFGEIAAANALSDVYAMGGEPFLALNLVMFPSSTGRMHLLTQILRGGAQKVLEAGVSLAGGHTIDDPIPKYGLSVTGRVHPDRIIANKNGVPDRVLILTKALGTGIVMAGEKAGMCSVEDYEAALLSMKRLNKNAATLMQKYDVRCATDITGFGLIGHALKMARASDITIEISAEKLPLLAGAYDLSDAGCIPGAAFRNQKFTEAALHVDPSLDYSVRMIAFDAQTSGGMLLCVERSMADALLNDLLALGESASRVIGQTITHEEGAPWIVLK